MKDQNNLSRKLNEMPDFVERALASSNLIEAYFERPAYQRNDYLGWIARAKREDTKIKRMNQMLDELREGGVYMKMDHPPSKRT